MFVTSVSFANIYRENRYLSDITSQSVLWEKLHLLEKDGNFTRVRCEDDYEGWISNLQYSEYENSIKKTIMVSSPAAIVYSKADELSGQICKVSAASSLPLINEKDDWLEIDLPDSGTGWIKKTFTQSLNGSPREIILEQAYKYLGVPYFWGGKTCWGLDCSGYMQLLHKLAGIKIRRDSPMQFEDAHHVSSNPLGGNPGDLLFFAEKKDRITHVALKINEHQIIHARGKVKVNSLDSKKSNFDKNLLDTFVAVKTFLKD